MSITTRHFGYLQLEGLLTIGTKVARFWRLKELLLAILAKLTVLVAAPNVADGAASCLTTRGALTL